MTATTGKAMAIHIERKLPAPPHAVYRAWLEPDLVRRWMAPGSQQVTRVEIVERPGGAYRTWKADPAGTILGGFDSELLELVEDRRLVFRWGFIGPQRRNGPSFDTLLTVALRPDGEGTVLSLDHERLDELAAAMPEIAESVESGWQSFLDELAELVQSGDSRGTGQEIRLTGLARELLAGPNYAHLATILPDGSPYSTPLWVDLEGELIAFLTGPGSRKARNIARDPRVAISITQRDRPFTMAHIRGRVVRRLEGDAAWAIIDRISHKYVGSPYARDNDRVVFLVEPEHSSSASLG